MDETEDRPHDPVAPRFRRVVAVFIDFALCIGLMHLVFGLGALIVPSDSSAEFYAVLFPAMVVGFAYLLVLPTRTDTLGKWLFGLRIERTLKSSGHFRPTFGGMMVRTMLLGLWPINLLMMLFSSSRQHLGDRLANTTVRFVNPDRHLAVGLVVGIVAAVVVLKGSSFALKAASTRTEAYAAAVASVEEHGMTLEGLPIAFVVGENHARFDLSADAELWRVVVRLDGTWTAEAPEKIQTPGLNSTFAFGMGNVSTSF